MFEWDVEELAALVCAGNTEDAEKMVNEDGVENALFEKYEVSFDQYSEIVRDLLGFTPVVQAGITSKKYHAFVLAEEQRMVVRKEVIE